MNPSFKKLRELAKERKIKYYCFKSKEKLCKKLGLDYVPYTPGLVKRTPIRTMLRCISNDKIIHFPSFIALSKAVERNIGSVLYYEKTKKPMPVVGPGLSVPPGQTDSISLRKSEIDNKNFVYNKEAMESSKVKDLREIARSKGLKGWYRLRKSDLISFIISEEEQQRQDEAERKEKLKVKRRAKKARYRANRRARREAKEVTSEESEEITNDLKLRYVANQQTSEETQRMIEKLQKSESMNYFTLRYLLCLKGY